MRFLDDSKVAWAENFLELWHAYCASFGSAEYPPVTFEGFMVWLEIELTKLELQ